MVLHEWIKRLSIETNKQKPCRKALMINDTDTSAIIHGQSFWQDDRHRSVRVTKNNTATTNNLCVTQNSAQTDKK